MDLSGKVAIVTGSTSGIGLGILKALAQKGCSIVMHGLGERDVNQAVLQDIQDHNQVSGFLSAEDISTYKGCYALIDQCLDTFQRIDILVNNAGIQYVAPIEAFPADRYQAIIDINLSGYFYAIQRAIPSMYAQKFGRIINIASSHGLVASALKSAYVAAKHGVVGLTKAVALEAAGRGVTCNAVCPGWVLTPLVQKQIAARAASNGWTFEQAEQELLLEKQPSGQFVTPEQIGEFIVFLCSKGAEQITGSALSIDGGWVAV